MESVETALANKAKELCEALRDFAYTRKDDDKKRVTYIQQELLQLWPSNHGSSSS